MKRFMLCALALVMILSVTGCKKRAGREDIIEFVKSEYGLKDFDVSKTSIDYEDYNGYTDSLWAVSTNDEWGTNFYVQVDTTHSSLGINQILSGNYYDMILKSVAAGYELNHLSLLESSTDEGFETVKLVGDFENVNDLKELFDEAYDFRLYLINEDIETEVKTLFRMMTPLRYSVVSQPDGSTGYEVQDGDFKGTMSTVESTLEFDAGFTDTKYKLVKVALDYQLEDNLAGLSENEISEICEKECRRIGKLKDEDSEEVGYYDRMSASWLGYGVSYGSLYKILLEEGFDVDGDFWHYSFTGVNGDRYEISYDFIDELDYHGETHKGYYYLVNGEVQPMDFYFYNHFKQSAIEKMTGLKLTW